MTQWQVAQEVSEVQAGAGVNGFIRVEIEFPGVNSASDHKGAGGKYYRNEQQTAISSSKKLPEGFEKGHRRSDV
jgi:hypothetical protein